MNIDLSLVKISSKHHYSQTVRARYLKFWDNFHHPQCVRYHMSRVTCQISCLMYRVKQSNWVTRRQYKLYVTIATGKRTKFMKYFTEEPHGNFTMNCLEEAEGSAATRGFSQTVWGKIAMGLRVKYFMDFVLFSVAIVTYGLYCLLVT